MDEKTNLDCASQIAKLMAETRPGEPYACYLARKVKVDGDDRIAVDSPVIWKGATDADMLAFYAAVIRAASTHAAQLIQSLPENSRGNAMHYLKEMYRTDMPRIGPMGPLGRRG